MTEPGYRDYDNVRPRPTRAEATEAGRRAGLEGTPTNTYGEGLPEYDAWRTGWTAGTAERRAAHSAFGASPDRR